jgi:uncharacterized membrane protein
MVKFLQRHFLTGLLAITPLAITGWILWQFYLLISGRMRPLLNRIPAVSEAYPEFVLTVMGLVGFVLAIILVGMFTRNIIGVAFFRLVERVLTQIPVVKSVFTAVKQIAEVLLQDKRQAFKRVALFEYPRRGLYSVGFVTKDDPGHDLVAVFLPTTPNPTSGYMLMVPRKELVELEIPVEEAIKLIVSGGSIMTPEQAECLEAGQGMLDRGNYEVEGGGE